jgi:hypothetical protein
LRIKGQETRLILYEHDDDDDDDDGIQQDPTLDSLFYLETALHVSGGTSTHHQERKQPLLLPATIAAGSSNGVKNTRCCRYSCLRS